MAGNTIYLNGIEPLTANNSMHIPLDGLLGEVLAAVNNVSVQIQKGQPVMPAQTVLNNVITNAAKKLVGQAPVLPMIVPAKTTTAVVMPAVTKSAVVVTPVAKPVNQPVTTIQPVLTYKYTGLDLGDKTTGKAVVKNGEIITGRIESTTDKGKVVSGILVKKPIGTVFVPSNYLTKVDTQPVSNQPSTTFVPPIVTKSAVINQPCTNCAPPVRKVDSPPVKLSPQTGGKPKKQIRPYNAAELNAMTRVVIEPIRLMLVENLKVAETQPETIASIYNVETYKNFIKELLAGWNNPVSFKAVLAKYKGKIENTQAMNVRARNAALSGISGYVDITQSWPTNNSVRLGSLGWFGSDFTDWLGDTAGDLAKSVGDIAKNAYGFTVDAVDKSISVIGDAGRAIGEGLKNAAVWTVGMLQKYNPIMIAARSAFRGLVAINFRGWASDMQGMRDRGEDNKIKDVWTGTFVGGDWGDLLASINTGSGRNKVTTTDAPASPAVETISAPPPPPVKPTEALLKVVSQENAAARVNKYNADATQYNKDHNPTPKLELMPAWVMKEVIVKTVVNPAGGAKVTVKKIVGEEPTGTKQTQMKPAVNAGPTTVKQAIPSITKSAVMSMGSLGEAITAATLLATATPIIVKVTDAITKVTDTVKKVSDGVDDVKKITAPFLPPSNNTPQVGPGTTYPPGTVTPAPNNNPATPVPTVSYSKENNTTMIVVAAVAVLVLGGLAIASSGNKPQKPANLQGLNKPSKGKTIAKFEI
ncbi:MAG: hypothetical protein V4538_02400 [Bacteroidota bacterium]